MKKIFSISLLAALLAGSFNSCSEYEDPICPSIFEITPDIIDQSKFSAPLDSFCKKNFLQTYNVDFKYKMEDVSSDVNKNLSPASFDKCEQMAVLTKYLWYDVYKNNVGNSVEDGTEFLKKNSPRIIHLIGSKNINPVQGTEILGTAQGGIKITLYRSNTLDISNLDYCNEYFFKTMHHEFGHQLCSRFVVPLEYRQLSSGFYDALGWQETCDSVALGDGFITDYSRNMYEDDFVEMLSKYVTSTPMQWEKRLNVAKWQWEEVTYDSGSKGWSEFEKMQNRLKEGANIDSIGYVKSKTSYKMTIVRKLIKRTVTEEKADYAYAVPDDNGEIQYVLKEEGKTGTELIQKKLEMLTTWLFDNYNIDINKIRQAVLTRSYVTDKDGNLVLDAQGQPINRIVQPYKVDVLDEAGNPVLDENGNPVTEEYPSILDYLVKNMRNYKTIDDFNFIKTDSDN